MKVSDVMTTNLVAAREGTTAGEIGTKLLIGNFNGLPVINSSIKVISIVTAVDILRAIRQGKNLDSIRSVNAKSCGSEPRCRDKAVTVRPVDENKPNPNLLFF